MIMQKRDLLKSLNQRLGRIGKILVGLEDEIDWITDGHNGGHRQSGNHQWGRECCLSMELMAREEVGQHGRSTIDMMVVENQGPRGLVTGDRRS